MNHFAVQHTPFVFPVQVSILDGINASVNPEQFLAHIVNRQAIWPANFFVNKYGQVGAIHTNPIYGWFTPVGEIQIT